MIHVLIFDEWQMLTMWRRVPAKLLLIPWISGAIEDAPKETIPMRQTTKRLFAIDVVVDSLL